VCWTAEEAAVPVKMLRDTGSLLLQGILPPTGQSSTGASVLVQVGVLNAPLYKIYLISNLVFGEFTVGIRSTLPAQGISLILGNDLAEG